MVDDLEMFGKRKKSGVMKWIVIIVILLLLLAAVAVGLRIFTPGLIPGWGQKNASSSDNSGGKKTPTALYPMKPFIVNLVDPSGKRYLKLAMSLELDRAETGQEIDQNMVQVQDGILTLLSSKSYDDISTVEGKRRLRSEIVNRCNTILRNGQVQGVYFTEFVVQ